MKILGICGSPRQEKTSGTARLVQAVCEASGCDYEYISLRGKKISGCIACLGCVQDNICKVEDDLAPLREKIMEADAYVIGAPNYYTGLNVLTHALLERWFQFRHQAGNLLWGSKGEAPADDIEKFLAYNFIETVAKVAGQGAASCFSCGYGETCAVGIPRMLLGEGVKITPDIIPDVGKQPEVMQAAVNAGRLLGERLRHGHDRQAVTQKVMQALMAKFEESV
jgi:hypothetical protein